MILQQHKLLELYEGILSICFYKNMTYFEFLINDFTINTPFKGHLRYKIIFCAIYYVIAFNM